MPRNKYLTKNMERILDWMRTNAVSDEPDEELTRAEPGGWWMGHTRVSGATCGRLLRLCLISENGRSGESTWYILNEDGRKVLDDPEYTPRIVEHCPLAGMTKGKMA